MQTASDYFQNVENIFKIFFSLNDGKNKEYAIKDDDKLYKFFAV